MANQKTAKMPLAWAIRSSLSNYRRDSYLGQDHPASIVDGPMIDCELGYSPFGMCPRAAKAQIPWEEVAVYGELFYDRLLKPHLTNRFGAQIRASQWFFGHGSFNIAERVIHKLLPNCPRVMGPGPQFNEIPTEAVAAGGVYISVSECRSYSENVWLLARRLQEQTVGYAYPHMIYLDNPNNPTGYVLVPEELREIIRAAERRGAIVLVDEAYGDFLPVGLSAISLIPEFSNLIVIRSFSKALGLAAARVGYAAMSLPLAELYRKIDVPFEPALPSAILARETLIDPDFIPYVQAQTRYVKAKVLQILGIDAVRSQNLPFRHISSHPDVSICLLHAPGVDLYHLFYKYGITVEPGAAYQQVAPWMDNSYVRLRIPHSDSLPLFAERISLLRRELC